MSKLKKSIIAVAASTVVFIAGGTAYVSYTDQGAPAPSPTPSASVTPSPSPSASPSPSPSGYARESKFYGVDNKYVDEEFQAVKNGLSKVTQDDMTALLHHMTHQKVKADDKWLSVEMTPEHIKEAREIVEKFGKDWEKGNDFLEIVKRWEAGGFSQVDKDHNYFWTLEGGTVGEATGILSSEEEKAFIEKNFKK
ncbi:DUF6241 domain-containing protein [Paenibacillus sp. CC-CFT747]|nr:DUF6241 domain-containing protein [Paenibacillus sp. CC-CFT747]